VAGIENESAKVRFIYRTGDAEPLMQPGNKISSANVRFRNFSYLGFPWAGTGLFSGTSATVCRDELLQMNGQVSQQPR